MGSRTTPLGQSATPVDSENQIIPLWKHVDSNYYYEEGETHRNGFLFFYVAGDFTLHLAGAFDTYKMELLVGYSSLTFAAYAVPSGATAYTRLTRTDPITAAGQAMISAGYLYVSVASGAPMHGVAFSPSDFTRIDSGSSLRLGMSAGENIVVGASYNNDICVGYFKTSLSDVLYDDNGQIRSPGYEDQTLTPTQCYFPSSVYIVGADPIALGDNFLALRGIVCSERELTQARTRKISSLALVRIGDGSGNGPDEFTYLHPYQIVNATMDWDASRMIEVSFKSTTSGAFVEIKNNNAFDVFVSSIEIWGLWGVRQSTTGDFGGAIMHASYSEHHASSDNGATIENEFVQSLEQAKDVADYYLDIGTNHLMVFENIRTNIGTIVEIGDKFQINMEEFGEEVTRLVDVVVTGKTIKPDGVYLTARIL